MRGTGSDVVVVVCDTSSVSVEQISRIRNGYLKSTARRRKSKLFLRIGCVRVPGFSSPRKSSCSWSSSRSLP